MATTEPTAVTTTESNMTLPTVNETTTGAVIMHWCVCRDADSVFYITFFLENSLTYFLSLCVCND